MANKKTQKKRAAKAKKRQHDGPPKTTSMVTQAGANLTFMGCEVPASEQVRFRGLGATVGQAGSTTTVSFPSKELATKTFNALFNLEQPWGDFVDQLPDDTEWRSDESEALAASLQ